MTTMKRWGKAALGVAASAAMLLATPLSAMACTQIYVGNQLTANGAKYLGRNEDAYARQMKVFGVQQPRTGTIEYSSAMSSFKWSKTGTTYRHTYVRDEKDAWNGRTDAYAEDGTNSEGLTVDATESISANDNVTKYDPFGVDPSADELWGGGTSTGIGEYNVTDILLDWCKTPEEAIKLLGSLIDQYGAFDGNELTISNQDESWCFEMLSGHQWIAFKMPDDKVSVDPNMENLQFKVDINDPSQCIHSADLVNMPQKNGFLVTYDDGTINVGATYGPANAGSGQNSRYFQGHAYFGATPASTDYTINAKGSVGSIKDPQMFFTPGGSNYDTFFILRSLATRGQGTSFNTNQNPAIWPIGNVWTYEGHFFQIKQSESMNIGTTEWLGLSRTPYTVSLPEYTALITKTDPLYGDINTTESNGHATPHTDGPDGDSGMDNVKQAMEEEPAGNFDFIVMDLNTLCLNNQKACTNIRGYEDAIQKDYISQQNAVQQAMRGQNDSNRTQWANELSAKAVQSAYEKLRPVLHGLRAQLQSGDTTTAYMPEDYDAATKMTKTPLVYGSTVIAPAFTQTPKSATYTQGDKAAPLTAKAVENNDEITKQTLTYAWYAKKSATTTGTKATLLAVDANAPAGYVKVGDGDTFTPSTDTVGTTQYLVRVTNNAGLTTDATATVTTTAAKTTPTNPTKPSKGNTTVSPTKPTTGTKTKSTKTASSARRSSVSSASPTASSLAKTGSDVEGILAIALIATAGGAIAIGVTRKKKMNA